MKTGDLAIFRGIPVGIQSINGNIATIKHCLKLLDEEEMYLLNGFQTEVSLDKLTPFNEETAKELRDRYCKQIRGANIVTQAIDDCLNYL